MSRNRLPLFVVSWLSCFIVSAGVTISFAHPASDWFPAKWGSNRTVDGIKWRFANNVPGGAFRDRVKDGAAQWNALNQSMAFNFEQNQSDYSSFPVDQCPGGGNPQAAIEKDAIHYGPISGDSVGQTFTCTFQDAGGTDNNSLHSFQIKIDSNETWNTSTGSPSGSQLDLWSLMAHEFGHATGRNITFGGVMTAGGDGFGHFVGSPNCTATQSAFHTMCQGNLQQTWKRSLNTHDIDTFNNAY